MIAFLKEDKRLLLRYTADGFNNARWVDVNLNRKGHVILRGTFKFQLEHYLNDLDDVDDLDDEYLLDDDTRLFMLGVKDRDYFRIDKEILRLKYDLLLSEELLLTPKTFTAERKISVFGKIDDLTDEPIIIGGEIENAIPIADFENLLKNFPSSTELRYYSYTRVAGVLKEYLGTMSDPQQKLERYMSHRRTIRPRSRIKLLKDYEPQKYEYVRDELQKMLNESDSYIEKDWQKLIVDFLLLIFPKYVAVLENLHIKDFYSNSEKVTNRYIDLTLVDANGTIDVIEIKKPFTGCLLSKNKYRDNNIPHAVLSGSVMQVEKYIFHLNKWGKNGEKQILKKRETELPPNFKINVTNPRAIIVLGRDIDFTDDQNFDFEIIKRKYANIIDIMTYDDLLRRLDNIITMIYRNYSRIEENATRR